MGHFADILPRSALPLDPRRRELFQMLMQLSEADKSLRQARVLLRSPLAKTAGTAWIDVSHFAAECAHVLSFHSTPGTFVSVWYPTVWMTEQETSLIGTPFLADLLAFASIHSSTSRLFFSRFVSPVCTSRLHGSVHNGDSWLARLKLTISRAYAMLRGHDVISLEVGLTWSLSSHRALKQEFVIDNPFDFRSWTRSLF